MFGVGEVLADGAAQVHFGINDRISREAGLHFGGRDPHRTHETGRPTSGEQLLRIGAVARSAGVRDGRHRRGVRGTLQAGGVEWMQAGRGMWHGGGLDKAGRTRGFQLWIALPPELELGPTISIYQGPDDVPQDGPARVLLGTLGSASNAIASPSPINYLAVRLKAGARWRYKPPTGHSVLWAAIASGLVSVPDELRSGDFAAFEPSSEAVEFEALTDTEFVLGSAAAHEHDLVLGYYSVHTSPEALRNGEAYISSIKEGTPLRMTGG